MFGGPFGMGGMGGMGGMMGGMGGMGAIQPAGIWHFEEFCTPWCKTLQTRWANGANAGAHGANETSATTCVRGWKIAQIEEGAVVNAQTSFRCPSHPPRRPR